MVGEAGIGKTTLIRTAVRKSGRKLFEGGGFGTLSWMPYLALRRAVERGLGGDPAAVAALVEQQVGPDVLFVDDLHWVDEETLAALELCAGRIGLVVAIRETDPGTSAALSLVGRAGMELVRLQPLNDADATEIINRLRPDLSHSRAAALVARAGGNPLLLEELSVSGEASSVLQRALTRGLDDLPADTRDIIAALAVAERPVPKPALGNVGGSALTSGLVTADARGARIRHVVVATAVRDSLDGDALRRAHALAARIVDTPSERARHQLAAGDFTGARASAEEGLAASSDPRDRAALLLLLAQASDPTQAFQLRLAAARALDAVSDWPGVNRALAGWGQDGGTEEQRVELSAILAHAAYVQGDLAASADHLSAAREHQIDLDSVAAARRAIESATFAVNVLGDPASALEELAGVIAHTPEASTQLSDLAALQSSILLLTSGGGDPSAIFAACDAAFAEGRYRTAADMARVAQFLLIMGSGSEAALEFLKAQATRFDQAGVAFVAREFLAEAARAATLAGNPVEGLRLADEVLEEPAPERARHAAYVHRAFALSHLGQFEQAAAALTEARPTASADFFGRGELLIAEALLAFWSGRSTVAAKLADEVLQMAEPIPGALAMPRLTRAWASVEIGKEPDEEFTFRLTPSLSAAPIELTALRAWHASDFDAAAKSFAAAAMAWRGFDATHELLCRWAAAEALRRAGDDEDSIVALREVLDDAGAMGFEPLAARVRRSLRLAGVRDAGAPRSPATAFGGLTSRERELVGLVERGLTNAEIARRLGLGRPTVARMLASAMTKLGVNSRAQLAATVPLQ